MKTNAPGAVASLVCGIISIVLAWLGWGALFGLILGIVGISMSNKAKRLAQADPDKFEMGGVRSGGFVCSIIGTVLSAIMLIVVVLIIGVFAAAASQGPGF